MAPFPFWLPLSTVLSSFLETLLDMVDEKLVLSLTRREAASIMTKRNLRLHRNDLSCEIGRL
jgi:hypothetical protein